MSIWLGSVRAPGSTVGSRPANDDHANAAVAGPFGWLLGEPYLDLTVCV
jgi:hypothetical protein